MEGSAFVTRISQITRTGGRFHQRIGGTGYHSARKQSHSSTRGHCPHPYKSKIREVTDADIAAVTSFLESHLETSLFLLNNLGTYGPRLTKAVYSGNFRAIEEDGRMVGVFAMTRRGTVLAQTGGRTDFSPRILDVSRTDNIAIRGVIGEWQCAASIWDLLRTEDRLEAHDGIQGDSLLPLAGESDGAPGWR